MMSRKLLAMKSRVGTSVSAFLYILVESFLIFIISINNNSFMPPASVKVSVLPLHAQCQPREPSFAEISVSRGLIIKCEEIFAERSS
ncbi:hypothetical protein BDU57DRAFT_519328 [Ampelomyces quisqualis]|uniref:Uncharacterized protein n=1 Tax=Ampelomyces quisqualis TaxID=50730 RepID=A0A6A5QFP7_AMPQU|nr:hypothetical protein BDU57DRAFT_519328 [Ampelomyces quisqualis]